ncbi:hypothetical protein C7974DRAFT_393368 [Boeremia exigua]|uniref:uncharacterized protein n=1 Tax=Boeremia exigua TaxID=749465 RepID=UPI001E8E5565|nr:uncharacterized protein C7974DRAFT_393368 [Boeremia exigua]KAH6633729.1 hypothetical protein C7974DRAFT_393368 [Boeremia exigua]
MTHDQQPQQSLSSSQNNQSTFRQRDQSLSRYHQYDQRNHPYQPLHAREDERWPRLPQQKRYGDSNGAQDNAPKAVQVKQGFNIAPIASSGDSNNNDSGSGKRKRDVEDCGENEERSQSSKRHQSTSRNAGHLEEPPLQTPHNGTVSVANSTTVKATSTIKTHQSPILENTVQIPTPPSSTATPEQDGCVATPQESTPTPAEKIQDKRDQKPSVEDTGRQSKKRQRTETESPGHTPKRPRQTKSAEATAAQRPIPPSGLQAEVVQSESPSTPVSRSTARKTISSTARQQRRPVHHVKAQAVRPESSFAPVSPNNECDLKFIEYGRDSVPILYSSMIRHSKDTELLASPSGMLFLNALAAIEASSTQSKLGWPSIIELLGRTPNKNIPTRILDDIDIYLRETEGENQLYVATDCGLLRATEYLKLIGVPDTQPVRFKGRIPPWANAALRSREQRRVTKTWGQEKYVRKDMKLGSHQIALMLETHADEREHRAKEAVRQQSTDESAANASSAGDGQSAQTEETSARRRDIEAKVSAKPEPRYMEILETELGGLPLPAGSVVDVYKVDDDDNWAYGRVSGTNKTGRFPIKHTCPVDWSLDRFSGTNNSLREPLPKSYDPADQNWNGLIDWVRRCGFAEGPTWKETCAAAAAAAKDAKERNIAARKKFSSTNSDPQARKSLAELPTTHEPLKEACPAPTSNAIAATEPATNIPTTAAVQITSKAESTSTSKPLAVTETAAEITSTAVVQITSEPENATISDDGTGKGTDGTASPETDVDIDVNAAQTSLSTSPVGKEVALKPDEHRVSVQEDAASATVQEPEVLKPNEEEKPDAGEGKTVAPRNPFTVPRLDPFAKNDTQGPELLTPSEEEKTKADEDEIVAPRNPFTVPRCDPFARNDDIEYDWGDSDDDL